MEGQTAIEIDGKHKAQKHWDINSPIPKQDLNAQGIKLAHGLNSQIQVTINLNMEKAIQLTLEHNRQVYSYIKRQTIPLRPFQQTNQEPLITQVRPLQTIKLTQCLQKVLI